MPDELRNSVPGCCADRVFRGDAAAFWLHKGDRASIVKPVLRLCTGLVLIAGVAATRPLATAAAGGQDQAAPAFKSRANLVALNVTVQDASARYVTGLQAVDFAVYEDGVQREVRFVGCESLPIDLILLLDTSRSMAGKVEGVRAAAQGFLDTLRPGDRGAVVAFNEHLNVVQPLTSDGAALTAALQSARAKGNTALRTALYVSLKEFGLAVKTDGAIRRQAIAVLSDGEDTASMVTFEDVLALARQTGVNVYTVKLRSGDDAWRQAAMDAPRFLAESDFEMKALARETGALSFFPFPGELGRVYASIAEELANQYAIGYEPGPAGTGGQFHRVSVRIVSRPDLRTRTRSGYTTESHAAAPR
jgi:VWFA-related protein